MRFLSKFFKRWYLYLVLLLLFPVVATVYAKNTLSVYESTALLYVIQSTNNSGYLSPAQNGADAMSQALQSETFCVTVAKGTGLATVYNLNTQAGEDAATARIQSEITITPTAVGQNYVSVTVDDKNPQMARDIAASFISAFTANTAQLQTQFDEQQVALYQGQIQSEQSQLAQDQAKVAQYLQSHPQCINNTTCQDTDTTLAGLEQAVTQDQAAINDLKSKVSALNLEIDGLKSNAIQPYYLQDTPKVPLRTTLHLKKLIIYPIGGLAAALALIALIVGIQTLADRRVYTTKELKMLAEDMDLAIPAIESVPLLHGIGRQGVQDHDADGSLNGIFEPVLTVLPQLGNGQMTQELRRAIGVTVEVEE